MSEEKSHATHAGSKDDAINCSESEDELSDQPISDNEIPVNQGNGSNLLSQTEDDDLFAFLGSDDSINGQEDDNFSVHLDNVVTFSEHSDNDDILSIHQIMMIIFLTTQTVMITFPSTKAKMMI